MGPNLSIPKTLMARQFEVSVPEFSLDICTKRSSVVGKYIFAKNVGRVGHLVRRTAWHTEIFLSWKNHDYLQQAKKALARRTMLLQVHALDT